MPQSLEGIALTGGEKPIYRQIADAIADRIAAGELSVGDKLPPQREIARQMGVNLTTITRAFAALQEQGLVESRPGRGSIIAEPSVNASFQSAPVDGAGDSYVDLSVNRPPTGAYLNALTGLMPQIHRDPRYPMLQDFHAPEGPAWGRTALARWLVAAVGFADPSRVVMTNGAQHGLACVLGGVARPGDTILADEVTYQGFGALCRSLDLDLRPVAMDAGGMDPDAFEAACRSFEPRAVFLVPSLHNPTAITLSIERRRALAAIAKRHEVLIIEDDVYRPLTEDNQPAFIEIAPETTIHVTSFSKAIAPGMRLGAVFAPQPMVADIAAMLRINCWSISPLTALIATRMIEEGSFERIVEHQKRELRARQAILTGALGGYDLSASPTSTHGWLRLPEPWRGNDFARIAKQHGVGVLSGEAFTVGRDSISHAVRINIAAARSRADLAAAMATLGGVLENGLRRVDTTV